MLNQFSRTELIVGKEAMEILNNARIAVFGIGGVGEYSVEALIRSGIQHIDLIDDDKVCLTNLNRQIIATRSSIGKYKVDVMKERILDINPQAEVNVHKCFYLPETRNLFDFTKYDYVVDAVDTVCPLARVMRQECKKRKIKNVKVVYSTEKVLRPIEDMAISCRLHCICPPGTKHKCTERRDIPGSNAFVPSVAGLIIASEIIKDLTQEATARARAAIA